jgi:hypothetical protein
MDPLIIDIDIGHDFVYDETRICKKTGLLVKTLGVGWYVTGAVACVAHTMFVPYCIMLATMFASCCNSARYEYAFYKKHGARFYSLEEFNAWKNQQLPKLNDAFDTAEVIIKLCFFIASWPLRLTMYDNRTGAFSICELDMTVLKIHAVVTLIVYSCALLLFMCLWCSFYNNANPSPNPSPSPSPSPRSSQVSPTYAVYVNVNETGSNAIECCICLNSKAEPWVSTPCAHVFHRDCLSAWSQINATCPICRTDLS